MNEWMDEWMDGRGVEDGGMVEVGRGEHWGRRDGAGFEAEGW